MKQCSMAGHPINARAFSSRPGASRWVVALCLLGLFTGCRAQENAERAEAARVSRAIDALRTAQGVQRRKLLAALRAEGCGAERVCAVRSTCLTAYELQIGSLETITKGLVQVNAGSMGTAEATLASGRAELDRANKLAHDCTKAQDEIVRHFRL